MTGLKLAQQFVKLASRYADEGNTEAATRNFRAAQNSYEEFLKFLPNVALTPSQREQVERDRTQVRSNLDVLASRLKIDSSRQSTSVLADFESSFLNRLLCQLGINV